MKLLELLRDQAWTSIGVIVAILLGIAVFCPNHSLLAISLALLIVIILITLIIFEKIKPNQRHLWCGPFIVGFMGTSKKIIFLLKEKILSINQWEFFSTL